MIYSGALLLSLVVVAVLLNQRIAHAALSEGDLILTTTTTPTELGQPRTFNVELVFPELEEATVSGVQLMVAATGSTTETVLNVFLPLDYTTSSTTTILDLSDPNIAIIATGTVAVTYVFDNVGQIEQGTTLPGSTLPGGGTFRGLGEGASLLYDVAWTAPDDPALVGDYEVIALAHVAGPDGGNMIWSDQNRPVGFSIVAPVGEVVIIEKLVDFDGDGSYSDSEIYYAGKDASWQIVVTNTGDRPVYEINVTDTNGQSFGPFDLLSNGDTQEFVYTTTVSLDTVNTATAQGADELGNAVGPVEDDAEALIITQSEGLSHGFWKNHADLWTDPYNWDDRVDSVLIIPGSLSELADDTLLHALKYDGGPGVPGAARILLRTAVAAVLNAAHPEINYPLTVSQVVIAVNDALSSSDRATTLDLKDQLDMNNNLGGGVDAHGNPPEIAQGGKNKYGWVKAKSNKGSSLPEKEDKGGPPDKEDKGGGWGKGKK